MFILRITILLALAVCLSPHAAVWASPDLGDDAPKLGVTGWVGDALRMKRLANVTGASHFAVESVAELPRVYAQIALELRSQYAPQKKQLTDPEKYLDTSYYDAALAGR